MGGNVVWMGFYILIWVFISILSLFNWVVIAPLLIIPLFISYNIASIDACSSQKSWAQLALALDIVSKTVLLNTPLIYQRKLCSCISAPQYNSFE